MNDLREFILARLLRVYAHRLVGVSDDARAAVQSYGQDAFYAGVRAVESQRAAAAPPAPSAAPRARRVGMLVLELAASLTTLTGMWFGSTTVVGAAWYLLAAFVWIWLSVSGRLWGLMPLNLASLLIEILNLARALG